MKIVHVIISAAYKEGLGYQENILPQKHKELGNDVLIITHNQPIEGPSEYVNNRGVRVKVLKKHHSAFRKIPFVNILIPRTEGLFECLEVEKPDVVFVHNVRAIEHNAIIKYKKAHPFVRVFADNHVDYYNVPQRLWRTFLLKTVNGWLARRLCSICDRVWGVTPWRVKYLIERYGVPKEKVSLLVMGGDENLIKWDEKSEIRKKVRAKYNIPEGAFLLVTGGKIDKAKNIHLLAEAIATIPDVYLLIFGKCEPDMTNIDLTFGSSRIKNIGWISSDYVYDLYLSSDLGVFPGTHSVLWEQACASGLPCIFKDWDGGFNHVDVGGNCIMLKNSSKDDIRKAVLEVYSNKEMYDKMKCVAETNGRKTFMYSEIAKKSIQQV